MTLSRLTLVFLVSLAVLGLPVESWANAWNGHGEPYTADSGVGWYYSAERRAFFRSPASFQPPAGGPGLEWSYIAPCQGNVPGVSSAVCAPSPCTTPTGESGFEYWVMSRQIDPPNSGWVLYGIECIPGQSQVALADVEAEIRRIIEDKFREIAEPTVDVAPETGGLVHLPVLAWTSDPGDVTLQIEQPLPGEVRASPDYVWTWSNGATSTGPGRPYFPGLSPTATPDQYVHAVYDDRGSGSVTLTATWSGNVTVPGLPPVDIEPLVYTAPTTFEIREARTQLVDPYG